MKKQKISHHAGCIILEASQTPEFLFNIYDNGYPIKMCHGKLNLLGGGKNSDDYSPESLVKREINEEFSMAANDKLDEVLEANAGKYPLLHIENFAPQEDIKRIRNAVLENIKLYGDFLVTFKTKEQGLNFKYPDTIFSIFYSKLPQEIFEITRINLENGKSLVNDSFLKIASVDDLTSGKFLTTWATGRVLEELLKTSIPNPEKTSATKIGMPRKKFIDYLKDFEYHKF